VSNAEKLFGLQLQDLNQELSDALGYIRGRGVLITAVEPDSPADEAGLERGLVIYRAGNSETNSVKQIEELLRSVQSGTKLEFTVGVIRTGRQTRQLATLSMTAR
jgi:S1-C subfamily serine protease